MPRKARLNVPGTVTHVMARCLKSETLFANDSDRAVFLKMFEKYLHRAGYRCYAWVLMPNHYHIVVRSSDRELWQLMKPLNTSYASYHKKTHMRDGPLFRDRFKSIITQDQNYIAELVRYVHLNPVRAGICKSLKALKNYRWSGHNALLGKSPCPFQDTSAVLHRFGNTSSTAREAYISFLEEGLRQDESENVLFRLIRDSNAGIVAGRKASCWVIGDHDFIRKVLSQAEEKRLQIGRFEKEGCDLNSIAANVGKKFGVSSDRLKYRCRGGKESDARKVFVYVAARKYRTPSKIIADFCGVGIAAVSSLAQAGHEIAVQRNLDI